jgi:hypothetical protein
VAQYKDKLFAVLVSWSNFLDPKISSCFMVLVECGAVLRIHRMVSMFCLVFFDKIDRPVLGTIVPYIYNLLLFCDVEMLKCKDF